MSVRYGVSLIVQPSFTAGLHRVRQLVCNQYASWAAEMHMAHLPLIDYFACPEELVAAVDAGLDKAVEDFNQDSQAVLLTRQQVTAVSDGPGHLFVPFVEAGNDLPDGSRGSGLGRRRPDKTVRQLRAEVLKVAASITGATQTQQDEILDRPLRFDLMRYAHLPPRVFQSAANFAAGALDGVDLAMSTFPVELVLLRLESEAAGEDWDAGGWAADLSWRVVNAYPFKYA